MRLPVHRSRQYYYLWISWECSAEKFHVRKSPGLPLSTFHPPQTTLNFGIVCVCVYVRYTYCDILLRMSQLLLFLFRFSSDTGTLMSGEKVMRRLTCWLLFTVRARVRWVEIYVLRKSAGTTLVLLINLFKIGIGPIVRSDCGEIRVTSSAAEKLMAALCRYKKVYDEKLLCVPKWLCWSCLCAFGVYKNHKATIGKYYHSSNGRRIVSSSVESLMVSSHSSVFLEYACLL